MMQDNDESNAKASISSKNLILIVKWIFVMILGVMVLRIFQQKQQDFNGLVTEFYQLFKIENRNSIGLVFLLIGINWACEAKKWQVLTAQFQKIRFTNAFQSVLIGLTLGFVTPANVGDLAGRVLGLTKINRPQAIGTVLLGNGIQFYVTLIFGILSYLIIWSKNMLLIDKIIFGVSIVCGILGIFIFWYRNHIQRFTNRVGWIKKFEPYLNAFTVFEHKTFEKALIWTILRYLTYSIQFVMMLQIFQIKVDFMNLWAISCLVLLYKTLVPSVNFLGDLSIREISVLHFFSAFPVNISSVIAATFALWIINILIPVFVGGLFLLKLKFRLNRPCK